MKKDENVLMRLKKSKLFVYELNDGQCFVNDGENYFIEDDLRKLRDEYLDLGRDLSLHDNGTPWNQHRKNKAKTLCEIYSQIIKKAKEADRTRVVDKNLILGSDEKLMSEIEEYISLSEYELYVS